MAEGVRFELTELFTLAGFQDRYLKPLGHPSVLPEYSIFLLFAPIIATLMLKLGYDSSRRIGSITSIIYAF